MIAATTTTLLDAALEWHRAGVCVIPAKPGKRPAFPWTEYQTRTATEEEIRAWFAGDRFDGFGVVCGEVSGNLEMIELEGRARHLVDKLAEALIDHGQADLFKRIATGYTEETPSRGAHMFYRVAGPAVGNTKLATRPATPEELEVKPAERTKVLIETRGEGGFVVVAPSGGRVHPTGGRWEVIDGAPATIPTITLEERELLFAVAGMFDTTTTAKSTTPAPTPTTRPTVPTGEGGRPGDEFNARATWEEILLPHGWTKGHTDGTGTTYWTRPGKDQRDGISATTRPDGGLYVFSTSTEFSTETPNSKFYVFATLEHGGDLAAAARDLAGRGYGDQRPRVDLRAEFATTRPQEPSCEPVDDEDTFWCARPILTHLRTFARARMTSPWAVLGVTLARVATAVPFTIVLPPIIGSHASINIFVGIVGRSGSGKGAAESAAEDAVELVEMIARPLYGSGEGSPVMAPIVRAGVGSGEGLAHQYMRRTKEGLEWWDVHRARLFSVAEVDTLTALDQRRGSTLLAELRKAWAGEGLGFGYADPTKRLDMPRHSYRLALVVGIQPGRAGALLDDTDGGTPQRFLWMPATDPAAPDELPVEPTPWRWMMPKWPRVHTASGLRVIEVCDEAVEFIRANRRADLRGEVGALDAHGVLGRLKVAALLAILDGRTNVTPEDWHLAGLIDTKSKFTRDGVRATLTESAARSNRARAEAEAERTIVTTEKVEKSTVARISRQILKHLRAHGDWVTGGDLRRRLAGRDRQWFEAAIEAAEDAGQIESEHLTGQGTPGSRYRIRGEQ